ncbi:MAG: cysteine desulfurase [Flavobacteriales bacterium]|mgnify:CR=1 FL=1|jgi:cysteine desulfurase/selenocysteine lyase|tara:strand:- start:1646 stop:2866 length:1221 start_codon:yes stop_codon:yes gene_type:complete
MALDIQKIRAQFPVLHQEVNGKPLVYFDNGATSQKPQMVIDAITHYYSKENSNIHRGVHFLSQQATDKYEAAREATRRFINADSIEEIIITRGTTEAINLVASCLSKSLFKKGDEILISTIEHHSNIVPWQMACEQTGAVLKVIPVLDSGELDMDAYRDLLNEKTKLVAVNHISNALGTINPIEEMIPLAHAKGALVLIDGAQAVPHTKVDVQVLNADFYCFSAHKMYGPTGIGILHGKKEILEKMPPYHGGGEMIKEVKFEGSTYNDLPFKFEGGTPNIAGGIGLEAAIRFMEEVGVENIAKQEAELLAYATQKLKEVGGIRFVGEAKNKAGLVSFLMEGIHPYDAGTILDKLGIAIRTGHLCAQPVMARFDITGTMRASFAVYNTKEEIDVFIAAINRVKIMFG